MKDILERLSHFADLADVPTDQLEWLVANSEIREFQAGDMIFKKGDPIDYLQVILDGFFTFQVEQNGQFRAVGEARAGEITGLLPYSRAKTASAYA